MGRPRLKPARTSTTPHRRTTSVRSAPNVDSNGPRECRTSTGTLPARSSRCTNSTREGSTQSRKSPADSTRCADVSSRASGTWCRRYAYGTNTENWEAARAASRSMG